MTLLPQAAEAKAYYGLARNYRALEALVAALERCEILSGDELREVRRSSPAHPPAAGLRVPRILPISSSWRGPALLVVGEQNGETYLVVAVCSCLVQRSRSAPSALAARSCLPQLLLLVLGLLLAWAP